MSKLLSRIVSVPMFFLLNPAKVYGWLGWEYTKPARVPPACPFKPTATKVGAETIKEGTETIAKPAEDTTGGGVKQD
ncbi:hypothetical protein Bca4012_009750 [Brassica carinata]